MCRLRSPSREVTGASSTGAIPIGRPVRLHRHEVRRLDPYHVRCPSGLGPCRQRCLAGDREEPESGRGGSRLRPWRMVALGSVPHRRNAPEGWRHSRHQGRTHGRRLCDGDLGSSAPRCDVAGRRTLAGYPGKYIELQLPDLTGVPPPSPTGLGSPASTLRGQAITGSFGSSTSMASASSSRLRAMRPHRRSTRPSSRRSWIRSRSIHDSTDRRSGGRRSTVDACHSQPRSRASRAAAVRFVTPSFPIASDR